MYFVAVNYLEFSKNCFSIYLLPFSSIMLKLSSSIMPYIQKMKKTSSNFAFKVISYEV